jgi:hypothetical protein
LNVKKLIASLVAVASLAGAAFAAPVAWSPAAGSAPTYDFSAGQNSTGLAGGGILTSDGFLLNPQGFVASSSNGGAASDISSVILSPKINRHIKSVTIHLSGDALILTSGFADLASSLTATQIGGNGSVTGNTTVSYDAAGFNLFDKTYTLNIPSTWDSLKLTLSNTLGALAGRESGSVIELKTLSMSVNTAINAPAAIPLPLGALAAIPTLALAGWKMRRARK